MLKDYTHITLVLDRSGSMDSVKGDTIGGFNNFIAEQKKQEGKLTFSFIQFDHEYEKQNDFVDIKEVKELDVDTYKPRGTTALLDAVGRSISETGIALAKLDEQARPEKVIFVIQTDGFENASKEYTYDKISEMVKEQTEKYNWSFIFLGAGLEAAKQSQSLGIHAGNTMAYANNAMGNKAMYASVGKRVSQVRSMSVEDYADFKDEMFDDQDYAAQASAGQTAQVSNA